MPRPLNTERPLKQHQARTVFLRVPSPVWPLVSQGQISEFRAAVGNASQLWKVPLPTLAVTYRKQLSTETYDYRLMLLEGVRQEALGTISDEGLRRAGYVGEGAFARFRRDWTIHEKRRFEPLRAVFVYTVRPVQPGDLEAAGLALIEHLYGEYAQEAQARPRTVQAKRREPLRARRPGEALARRGG